MEREGGRGSGGGEEWSGEGGFLKFTRQRSLEYKEARGMGDVIIIFGCLVKVSNLLRVGENEEIGRGLFLRGRHQ